MENPKNFIIDRAHRLPKLATLPDFVPRDVIARIHFFSHIKDRALMTARKMGKLPDPFSKFQVFIDLSAITMQNHKHSLPSYKNAKSPISGGSLPS